MPHAVILLAYLLAGELGSKAQREAPSYTATSVLNSASNLSGSIAPNTFLSIYGANLAYTTKAIADTDIRGGMLPTILLGTGVTVFINRVRAHIYYVSPSQINILVPSDFYPGPAELQVALDGVWGPVITCTLQASAPALFQMDQQTAIAVHADGTLLTADSPALPDEYIVLYATGLGALTPPVAYGEIPSRAAQIRDLAAFHVLLDGVPLDSSRILYAGVSPGFGGLYQINIHMPVRFNSNPEVRLQTLDALSKPNVFIHASPSQ